MSERRVPVSVRMPKYLHAKLVAAARTEELSLNDWMSRCLTEETVSERIYQRDWREVLLDAINSPRLNAKDREFIESLLARSSKYQLTAAQLAWLHDIENKVYAAG
jgi:hypothetical protein